MVLGEADKAVSVAPRSAQCSGSVMSLMTVVMIVTMLQRASCIAPVSPEKISHSKRLAGKEMVCCKSHTVRLNAIAFHRGLGYRNEGALGFP